LHVLPDAEFAERLLISAFQYQTTPANPVPQPLRNHCVVMHMAGKLAGSQTLPFIIIRRPSKTAAFCRTPHPADFDISILNPILLASRAISGLESKVYRFKQHSPLPRFRPESIEIARLGVAINP
jgi:hypothetical protein